MARKRRVEEYMEPLTEEEQAIAIKYHDKIKPLLECNGLDYNEYYDLVICKYLWTIHRWVTLPHVHKWSLLTCLRNAFTSTAIRYWETGDSKADSLDFSTTEDEERTMYNYVSCSQSIDNPERLFTETGLTKGQRKTLKAVHQMLTPLQIDVMQMVGNGLSRAEIAELLGCSATKVNSTITGVRRKVEQGKLVYIR